MTKRRSGNPSLREKILMRRLIYIPIVHSSADMGSMSESLEQVYRKKYGRQKWIQRTKTVQKIWREIEKKISFLPLDYAKVKIYQDGLPKCGRELEIAKSAAAGGSKNYQLVLDLVEKGAQLIGTEDPNLLIQEYHQLRNTLDNLQGSPASQPARLTGFDEAGSPKSFGRRRAGGDSASLRDSRERNKERNRRAKLPKKRKLPQSHSASETAVETFVSQRDKYISIRINETLKDGETGFLFVGVVHKVNEMLPSDIQISYLLPL